MVGFHESPSPVTSMSWQRCFSRYSSLATTGSRPYRGLLPRTDKIGFVGAPGQHSAKAGYSDPVLPPSARGEHQSPQIPKP